MAVYIQSEDNARHAAINPHALKPDLQELNYQFLTARSPATGARADQRNYLVQPVELKRAGSWKSAFRGWPSP
jgi:hypothetical protein